MHEVKHSIREARIPAAVAEAWKPVDRPAAVLLRWFATHRCNYRCPYCRQNHARRQQIDGRWAHCFDNWPVDQWLRAFQRHFQARRLSLVITGGEPLVDHAPMAELVNWLTAMPTVECIRIDMRILQEYLPSFDYGYRTGLRSPLRQAYFFPAVAYQMNPWGRLHVGRHRTRACCFFDDELPPQFPGPVPCPQTTCVCLDRHSFLAGQERNCTTDPLAMHEGVKSGREH